MYKKCEEILNKLESEGKIKISNYQFPKPLELKLKLKNMLDDIAIHCVLGIGKTLNACKLVI